MKIGWTLDHLNQQGKTIGHKHRCARSIPGVLDGPLDADMLGVKEHFPSTTLSAKAKAVGNRASAPA